MDNKQLLGELSRLGYPLVETAQGADVHQTLATVVTTDNSRYWEGFPILLVNAAKDGAFDRAKVESNLDSDESKARFKELFLLSLAVYKLNGLSFPWARQYERALGDADRNTVREFVGYLKAGQDFERAGQAFSPERIQKTFQNYFTLEAAEARSMGVRYEDLSLEFALSQVFSAKQKELFKKKLKGEPLTKTEREYFSRTVKKKVSALANPELHRLAQKVAAL